MVGTSKIGTARALVHNVEQEHSLSGVILVFLQILRLLRGRALDLQVLDAVSLKSIRDLLHEVWELDEDEHAFFLGYTGSAQRKINLVSKFNEDSTHLISSMIFSNFWR